MTEARCTTVFCDLTVFGDNDKRRQRAVLTEMRARLKAAEELSDGYLFTLPPEPYMLHLLAELIELESKCCPFLAFTLEVKDGGHSITLRISGPEGTKDVLRAELHLDGEPAAT